MRREPKPCGRPSVRSGPGDQGAGGSGSVPRDPQGHRARGLGPCPRAAALSQGAARGPPPQLLLGRGCATAAPATSGFCLASVHFGARLTPPSAGVRLWATPEVLSLMLQTRRTRWHDSCACGVFALDLTFPPFLCCMRLLGGPGAVLTPLYRDPSPRCVVPGAHLSLFNRRG